MLPINHAQPWNALVDSGNFSLSHKIWNYLGRSKDRTQNSSRAPFVSRATGWWPLWCRTTNAQSFCNRKQFIQYDTTVIILLLWAWKVHAFYGAYANVLLTNYCALRACLRSIGLHSNCFGRGAKLANPYYIHLWFDAALVNKLVPCAWLLIGTLEVWRLRLHTCSIRN